MLIERHLTVNQTFYAMKHQGFILSIIACLFSLASHAQVTPQSQMEPLSRGVIAMPAQSGQGIFISWRLLGTDPASTTSFDLLRDGVTIASNLKHQTNYTDPDGTSASKYSVVTRRNGEVVETTTAISPQSDVYRVLQLDRPADGIDDLTHQPYSYTPNDCSVGDVDGDGEYEIIVKWQPSNKTDNGSTNWHPGKEYIDCYKLDGTKLWRIDMGINILAGDHQTQMLVYDFDNDGCSEIILRTAPGTKDGKGIYVNQKADDPQIQQASNTKDWRSTTLGTIAGGQEYVTIFKGLTGEAIHTIFYNPNRDGGYKGEASGTTFDWDDRNPQTDYTATYGNRGNRFLAAVAYLDGPNQRPSAVMCRGYYTQAYLWAVDFKNNKLTPKWLHASVSKTKVEVTNANGVKTTHNYNSNTFGTSDSYTAYGQGNHNLSVADVDGDSCDEIIYGAATIDNDGNLLYSTGLGHGDALHVADLIPSRPGYEVLRCCETSPYGLEIHDARTGSKIFHQQASKDTGRCIAANVSDQHEGYEFWGSTGNSIRETASGNFENFSNITPSSMNFRIFWDGDLLDELFDGAYDRDTQRAYPKITKWSANGTMDTALTYNGSQSCNGTKATPCLQADILGDWREEIVMWNIDNPSQLNIISSNIPSDYRVPTLMHDHNYRLAVAWQNVSYNQPPHLGYYLPNADFTCEGDEPLPSVYSYTVCEKAGDNIMRTTTGEDEPNQVVSVPYRRYNVNDGKLYVKEPTGGDKRLEYNHYFTLNSDQQMEILNYQPTDISNVVFLAEAEDIPGMTLCDNNNMRVRSSNSAAAYVASSSVGFTTLTPGAYQLTAFIHDTSKTPNSYWKFLAGNKEIANFNCTVVNIQEFHSEVFTITQPTTLYIPQCGNTRSGVDLIYVTRVPIIGDVNGDGTISVSDVMSLVSFILDIETDNFIIENADINGDGLYSVTDVTILVDLVLEGNVGTDTSE